MPKIVEYRTNGVRETYSRKKCNSCWDCVHCTSMFDVSHYMCRKRNLSSKKTYRFPYDNTVCKEFKRRNDKT